MKKLTLIIALCLYGVLVGAQSCTGYFIYDTQTEVDQFLIDNPTCTSIVGQVWLSLSVIDNPDPITNVDAFQNITSITGGLKMYVELIYEEPNLVSLEGFSSLHNVSGLVQLDDTNGGYITDVSPLSNLTTAGTIQLNLQGVADMTPFNNLTSVTTVNYHTGIANQTENIFPGITTADNVTIWSADDIDHLSILNSLVTANNVTVSTFGYEPPTIGNFDSFHNLQSTGALSVIADLFINEVSGFEQLETAGAIVLDLGKAIDMWDFPMLTELGSFQSSMNGSWWSAPQNSIGSFPQFPLITSTTGDVDLLCSVPDGSTCVMSMGFDNLEHIGGSFELVGDIDITEEIAVRTVGNHLRVEHNDFITNLELFNLVSVGGDIWIRYNDLLSDCSIGFLCTILNVDPASIHIAYNAPGCSSYEDLAAVCFSSFVSGKAYIDLECDGVFNNDDAFASNVMLVNSENEPLTISTDNGSYFLILAEFSETTISAIAPFGFQSTNSYTLVTTEETIYTQDFGICPDPGFHNVALTGVNPGPSPRPGLARTHTVHVKNKGGAPEHVQTTVDISEMPGVVISQISNGGVLNGNIITWDTPVLEYMEEREFTFVVYTPITTPVNTIYKSVATANIIPPDDGDDDDGEDDDPTDNGHIIIIIVVNSCDPNDKTANIPAVDLDEIGTDPVTLDYNIRFQNTGTAEAIFIYVEDIIEEDLNIMSFEMVDASHPYELTFEEGNKLKWYFGNINLPDSTSDEAGSHGFVHFRIKTKDNLALTDTITNSSAIYFDYNAPVFTNTATTVFYTCPVPPVITGEQEFCQNEEGELNTTEGWDNYAWMLAGNEMGEGLTYQLTNMEPGQFNYELLAETEYCTHESLFPVLVNATPDMPVITQNGNILSATGTGTFTWYMDGEQLTETSNTLVITESNTYAVMLTDQCDSGLASGIFNYTGIEEAGKNNGLVIMPNPASGSVLISSATDVSNGYLRITNVVGQTVLFNRFLMKQQWVNDESLVPGVYFVSLLDGDGRVLKSSRLVIE